MEKLEHGKEFLGRGWAFPFSVQPDNGRVTMACGKAEIDQSIRIILSTAKGERVMRPDFGCGIKKLHYHVINTALISQIEHDIREALRLFEARIEVKKILVNQASVSIGKLEIDIHYRIRETNQSHNYVYPFYLKEGS